MISYIILYHVMQGGDNPAEKVVANGDTVTHPSTTSNAEEQVELHPSQDISDNAAASEPHPPILTNGIEHSNTISDEKQTAVSIGDLTSMVNGRYSPLEKQETSASGLTSTERPYSGKHLH